MEKRVHNPEIDPEKEETKDHLPITPASPGEMAGSTDEEKAELSMGLPPSKFSPDPNTVENPEAVPTPPHTVFTQKEIYFIVAMASLAALLSPVSTTIYFPALNTLAATLGVSISKINLTVTTYLIMQGIAPTFVGTWSDASGRRPLYIGAFIVYMAANIGLALQTNYAALLVLRLVQSAGSSGTIALAYAVVADVSTSAERGRYVAYVSAGALLGPAFAPLIGGILIQFLGWRSVFWALVIFSGAILIVFLLFFPETSRKIVGNGSISPQPWNMSVLTYIKTKNHPKNTATPAKKRGRGFPNPIAALKVFLDPESAIVLMVGGVMVAGFQMINANLSEQLEDRYNFNSIQVGLCYIPLGVGCLVATEMGGRLVDWNYRRQGALHGITVQKGQQMDESFPLELARIQILLPSVCICTISILIYGWVLQYHTNLAGPLIMVFFMGFGLSASANTVSTMIVDLNLDQPATASSAFNLSRCLLGAGGVAAIVPVINAIGTGWTATIIALICLLTIPFQFLVVKMGPKWRKQKKEKLGRKKDEEERREQEQLANGSTA
ncbi:major facilitator superfamily domain-containing protein [Xylogone sp. PMI_703]|nr:major facilitator superfamily domain-containing protein [Xylogone sp. PMI_703]